MKQRGFTIVELLIVIVVIGILAIIAIVAYSGVQQRAVVATIQTDLKQSGKVIESYKVATSTADQYPADLSAVDLKASQGTTYAYNTITSPAYYCLGAINGATSYFTSSLNNQPIAGSCPAITGLIGWWPMNGNATDQSGNGRSGTLYGPTTTKGQNDQLNTGYSFNGTTTQYIDTGYNFPLETFTVSVWIKPDGTGPNSFASIISNTRDCCANYNGFELDYNLSTQIRARLWTGGSGPSSVLSFTTLTLNNWQHIALTYDGSVMKLYRNGILQGSSNYTGVIGTPANNVSIGKMGAISSGYSFGGSMDDARIYNRALSATEIATLNTAGAQ